MPISLSVDVIVTHELKAHPNDESYWLNVLNTAPSKSLNYPDLGDPEALLTGSRLPSSFVYTGQYSPISSMNRVESLLGSGTIIVRNNREFYSLWRYYAAITTLAKQSSPKLISWLADRSDALPPSRLDSLTFYCLNGFAWYKSSSDFWQITRDSWRRMYHGRNPISRLIALECADYWCEDTYEFYDVCKHALNEEQSLFHSLALVGIDQAMRDPAINRIRESSAPIYVRPIALNVFTGQFVDLLQTFCSKPGGSGNDGTVEWGNVRASAQETINTLKRTIGDSHLFRPPNVRRN